MLQRVGMAGEGAQMRENCPEGGWNAHQRDMEGWRGTYSSSPTMCTESCSNTFGKMWERGVTNVANNAVGRSCMSQGSGSDTEHEHQYRGERRRRQKLKVGEHQIATGAGIG